MDFYIFKRLLSQSVFLAVFGVLYSAFCTAVVVKYIFPFNWSWLEALMFGGAFSATDPVATIALLKDLGAPEPVGVLIEGESLLNDGTGFVIFIAFEHAVSGTSTDYSAGTIIGEMFFASIIGPLIGVAVAVLSLLIQNKIWANSVLQVSVTLLTAWGAFFAGNFAGASGVLSVVTAGVFVGGYSPIYIDHASVESIRKFWSVVDWVANTMLFGYAGFVVVEKLVSTAIITAADVGYLFVLYAFLNLIRFSAFVIGWPILSRIGYGFDWRKCAIVSWAGLRGAIGLISALILVAECKCPPEFDSTGIIVNGNTTSLCLSRFTANRTMFFMAGVVLLTLVINGPTTKYLLTFVRLSKETPAALILHRKSMYLLQKRIDENVRLLKRDPFFLGTDWAKVWANVPTLSKEALDETEEKTKNNPFIDPESLVYVKKSLERREKQTFDFKRTLTTQMIFAEARHRFLNAVKVSYTRQYREGACTSWPVMKILSEATSRAQDEDNVPLNIWEQHLKYQCEVPGILQVDWLFCYLPFHQSLLTHYILRGLHIATSFVLAHAQVEQDFVKTTPEDVAVVIVRENHKMITQAQSYLKVMEDLYPDVMRTFRTNMAIQRMLKISLNLTTEMAKRSELDEFDVEIAGKIIESQVNYAKKKQIKIKSVSKQNEVLFRSSYLFDDVKQQLFEKVRSHSRLQFFDEGKMIISRGGTCHALSVIVRGKVKVQLGFQENEILLDQTEKRPSDEISLHPTKSPGVTHFPDSNQKKRKNNIAKKLLKTSMQDHKSNSFDGIVSVSTILGPGDVLGEIELLTNKRSLSSVSCETPVQLYSIDFDFFRHNRLLEPDCPIMVNLCRQVALLALEAHYPAFRFALLNSKRRVVNSVQIKSFQDNPASVDLPSGKIVLVQGTCEGETSQRIFTSIAVMDVPNEKLIFSKKAMILFIPEEACSILELNPVESSPAPPAPPKPISRQNSLNPLRLFSRPTGEKESLSFDTEQSLSKT